MSLAHSFAISRRSLLAAGVGAAGLSFVAHVSFADDAETAKQYEEIVGKAVEYLRVKGQATTGPRTSTQSSRRVLIWPIMAPAPNGRDSISRCSATSIPGPA